MEAAVAKGGRFAPAAEPPRGRLPNRANHALCPAPSSLSLGFPALDVTAETRWQGRGEKEHGINASVI